MRKQLTWIGLFALIALNPLFSEEHKNEESPQKPQGIEISKISEAFGHLIGKNLENIGFKFDLAQIIKGLEDESAGRASPMTEVECVQAIASIQEELFKKQSNENLERAESFLKSNVEKEGMISLENGKVQYHIEAEGEGAPVEAHFSPLIRYTGKYLDGSVFSTSKEEELISLGEVIPGLKAGMVGMKEGEKRTVFIHPDLAYGTNGYLHPNSLLTFEVEVIQANASTGETADVGAKSSNELAESKSDIR